MFTKCSFDAKENKCHCYIEKNSIKKWCKKIKDCAMEIINCEEKEMIQLTDEENKSYEKQKECHMYQKKFYYDENEEKYHSVIGHCHYAGKFRGPAHNICSLNYKIPKKNSCNIS